MLNGLAGRLKDVFTGIVRRGAKAAPADGPVYSPDMVAGSGSGPSPEEGARMDPTGGAHIDRKGGGGDRKSRRKAVFAAVAAVGVLVFIIGFVLSVNVLNFLADRRDSGPRNAINIRPPSNLPVLNRNQQQIAEQSGQSPQGTGQGQAAQTATPGGSVQSPAASGAAPQDKIQHGPEGGRQSSVSDAAGGPSQPQGQTTPGPTAARREAPQAARQVSDFDPFKSEFLKKYVEAEKKEKRSSRSQDHGGDLADLEKTVKGAGKPVSLQAPPPPPPPPPPKKLSLSVSGVVISDSDTYAITDRGFLRVGNTIDGFVVERIEFYTVTLKDTDNPKDVKTLFVSRHKEKTTQGSGSESAVQRPAPVYYPPSFPPQR